MVSPARLQKFKQVLAQRQPDMRVIAEHVHKPHNIAAIMRTLDAVGGAYMHMVWPWRKQRFPRGTSKGSERFVELYKHENVEEPIRQMKADGCHIYAAHFSDEAIDFRKIDYTHPFALVMGSEKYGVTQVSAELADQHIIVPMRGMVSSLNVSVAASVILQEAHRQRDLAGLYQQARLSESEVERFLFLWTHPVFARKCDELEIDYPSLDEAGNVIAGDEWWEAMRQFPQK